MAANSSGGHHQKLIGVGGSSGSGNHLSSHLKSHCHHVSSSVPSAAAASSSVVGGHPKFKGHQRRQSVARLLPDISKLRLLSWLVEASSELINCDIAIMDGVYAKLNRSQESLLFWNANGSHNYSNHHQQQQPPPMPLMAPVATKSVISRKQSQLAVAASADASSLKSAAKNKSAAGKGLKRLTKEASRNHHSLPLPSYRSANTDSSSVATGSRRGNSHKPSSLRSAAGSLLFPARRSLAATTAPQLQQDSGSLVEVNGRSAAAPTGGEFCDTTNDGRPIEPDVRVAAGDEDEVDDEDDDDHSSAASSTTSSGIHGGDTSISSNASVSGSSHSGSSISDSSSCSLGSDLVSASMATAPVTSTKFNVPFPNEVSPTLGSAEQLSEKIRRTVMEHNYLQNLLVNVIRQHDRQRRLLNQQQQCQSNRSNSNNGGAQLNQQLKIDLADIADSLDDGCLCLCHSQSQQQYQPDQSQPTTSTRSSTLPAMPSCSSIQVAGSPATIQVSSRKVRRLRRFRAASSGSTNRTSGEPSRQDIINQLGGKLCESCFETHYWLHGCSIELTQQQQHLQQLLDDKLAQAQRQQLDLDQQNNQLGGSSRNVNNLTSATATKNNNTSGSGAAAASSSSMATSNKANSIDLEDLNAIIMIKNATFIKLIQQQVRSTISKAIELIDLIRKEIKSPESIKQKQLMKCFSTSIQLLTSVGNYVVPTQDISTFIPEVGLQQTTLFCLPPGDFDHLLIYPSTFSSSLPSNNSNQRQFNGGLRHNQLEVACASQYHLASAPDIPIRRRLNKLSGSIVDECEQQHDILDGNLLISGANAQQISSGRFSGSSAEQALSSHLQGLRTSDDQSSSSSKAQTSTPSAATATTTLTTVDSSSGASSNNSSASSSIARGAVQQSSLIRAHTPGAILGGGRGAAGGSIGTGTSASNDDKNPHNSLSSFEAIANLSRQQTEDDILFQSNRQSKFWQSSKFNFIKKLLHVKEQRLLRQQSKDRRIYNNKVQNKFRLVMRDLTHFNKSQQLLTTENGVNSLLTSMRNVLEFGLYLTVKLY